MVCPVSIFANLSGTLRKGPIESPLPVSQHPTYTKLFPITPSSRDVRRVSAFSRNDSSESKSLQRRTNELADACS